LRSSAFTSTTKVALPWPHLPVHVGDRVKRIDGRLVELASRPDVMACVTHVEHDFTDQLQTRIELMA
jgi:hypothetical protein